MFLVFLGLQHNDKLGIINVTQNSHKWNYFHQCEFLHRKTSHKWETRICENSVSRGPLVNYTACRIICNVFCGAFNPAFK